MTAMPGASAVLPEAIDDLWVLRQAGGGLPPEAPETVLEALELLDRGDARVARVGADDQVRVDERAKRAILLAFQVLPMRSGSAGAAGYTDRIPVKTRFDGVRVVPGAVARFGSYCGPGVVLMPSFVNVGGYVDAGTMVDTWATVGSCAQIGKRVHLSGGAGIGGVLEPPNAVPVVVEDDALIGSRAMITDGARVGEGSVVGAGTILNPSIPVIDAETGAELSRGRIPPWSVAVSASRPREFPGGTFQLPCVLVIRRLDPGERHDKAGLNAVLREHAVAT
jgi:2,3,4,5-tetrahydropyridine-2-carboxylate N-succinyltransferase